jgi:FKBP-type peptidyl-prolyl cis-trans isomerase FklB
MKKNLMIIALVGALLGSCTNVSVKKATISDTKDSVSYVIGIEQGLFMAKNIEQFPGGMNTDAFLEAFVIAFKGDSGNIQLDDSRTFIMNYIQEAEKVVASLGSEEGVNFLAENGKKKGVTTTASGLQYEVITKGDGAVPTAASTVKVHYHGMLLDGTVFDSSVDRNEPATFPVGGVIKGWTEALQLMPVGSKWKLTIPAELAYGNQGTQGIPANSVLVFDVELLNIEK